MAPPQPKAPAKPSAAPAGGVKKTKTRRPRNYDLGNGVVRFSKTRMFHKKVSFIHVISIIKDVLKHTKSLNFINNIDNIIVFPKKSQYSFPFPI